MEVHISFNMLALCWHNNYAWPAYYTYSYGIFDPGLATYVHTLSLLFIRMHLQLSQLRMPKS